MYDINYQIVIDTDKYAGNFERELCAYCTGYWDNETHGSIEARIFLEEVGIPEAIFPNISYTVTEDDDCPIEACQCLEYEPTNKAMNSVAIFFDEIPSIEQIDIIKKRAEKFGKEYKIFGRPVDFKVLGYRLMKKISAITPQEI